MCDCRKSRATLARFGALDPGVRRFGCCKPDPCDPCVAGRRRALAMVAPDPRLTAELIRLGLR